jgi:hypothetical protein
MPNIHKTPLLGWHPPAELSAWVRAEAGRRGVPISSVLNEAVAAYRDRKNAGPPAPPDGPATPPAHANGVGMHP